jgi:membrane-associated protease RseP (regulator of RpoE activity)
MEVTMKSRALLFGGLTIAALFGAAVRGDEPAKSATTDPVPSGKFQVLAQDWNHPVYAGQTLATFAALAHSNVLGVEVAAVEAPLRAQLDLKEGQGVVVTSAADDSAAAKAGLKQHDILVRIDDHPIASPEKFHELAGAQQGKKVVFHILRQGKAMEVGVTVPNTPVYDFADTFASYADFVSSRDNQYRIGVTLAQADDVLRSQLRLADGEGLVITDVVADGPAAKSGIRKHDVLVKLDGKRLTTVEACNAQIQELKDRKVAAVFYRGGKEMTEEIIPQLSATTEWTYPYRTNINTNLNTAKWFNVLSQSVLSDEGHVSHDVRWFADANGVNTKVLAPATNPVHQLRATEPGVTKQIAELKRQLEAMHKSLAALETAVQNANPPQQPEQKPQEKGTTDKPQP